MNSSVMLFEGGKKKVFLLVLTRTIEMHVNLSVVWSIEAGHTRSLEFVS